MYLHHHAISSGRCDGLNPSSNLCCLLLGWRWRLHALLGTHHRHCIMQQSDHCYWTMCKYIPSGNLILMPKASSCLLWQLSAQALNWVEFNHELELKSTQPWADNCNIIFDLFNRLTTVHTLPIASSWKQAKLWNQVPSLDHYVVQNSWDFLCWKYKEVVCFYVSNLWQ